MNVEINVHEQVNGDIFVKELSYENGDYATEQAQDTIIFSNSVSVTVIKQITVDSETVMYAYVHDHSNKEVISKAQIKKDGWYKIYQYVIPNNAWLEWATEQGILENYDSVYVVKDNVLYKYVDGELTQCYVEELLSDTGTTNVWLTEKNVFVIFNLWQCYLNYCKKMLDNECSKDSNCDSTCDDEMTKNRNLLWIFLNVIQYYVHFGMFDKAQEFLEEITGGCNTLCSNEMFSKDYNCNCGK